METDNNEDRVFQLAVDAHIVEGWRNCVTEIAAAKTRLGGYAYEGLLDTIERVLETGAEDVVYEDECRRLVGMRFDEAGLHPRVVLSYSRKARICGHAVTLLEHESVLPDDFAAAGCLADRAPFLGLAEAASVLYDHLKGLCERLVADRERNAEGSRP